MLVLPCVIFAWGRKLKVGLSNRKTSLITTWTAPFLLSAFQLRVIEGFCDWLIEKRLYLAFLWKQFLWKQLSLWYVGFTLRDIRMRTKVKGWTFKQENFFNYSMNRTIFTFSISVASDWRFLWLTRRKTFIFSISMKAVLYPCTRVWTLFHLYFNTIAQFPLVKNSEKWALKICVKHLRLRLLTQAFASSFFSSI